MSKFRAFDESVATGVPHRGFQLDFANGHSVSVTWAPKLTLGTGKESAEVALMAENGRLLKIWGYQSPERVANIIAQISLGYVPAGGIDAD